MDEDTLIACVEQYRELYDLQHAHYDDVQRRNNIWEEIGRIVICTKLLSGGYCANQKYK